MNSLISIVVPIYNVASFLDKCICSILSQTYKNIEVILVDDGSTDESGRMCDEFAIKDNRVRVIHKSNDGPMAARKTGFAVATGEYIMCVDSDDWIETDMCEELLESVMASGADCVVSGYVYETKNCISKTIALKDNVFELNDAGRVSLIEDWLVGGGSIISPLWAKLYRSRLIKQSYSNVPENMNQGEDFANFVNLIADAKKIICTHKIYYHYVYRNDSYSNVITSHEFTNLLSMVSYCRNMIIKRYINVNEKILDRWVIKQCCGDLKRLGGEAEFSLQSYVFNNPSVFFGKKIIIYGAGDVGKDYYSQLCRYEDIKILSWVDKNYKKFNYTWRRVEPLSVLLQKDYDVIVIGVKNKELSLRITNELSDMGVEKNKIFWNDPVSVFDVK